ncbi:MAG: hypothetical protein NTV51_07175 [Verrucomicrobia bacterium]|nr:hypothetical protein [Verrucomicrobiota bacterium]
MNLADVFTFLFVILGLMAVFAAYWLMTAGLFPRSTERCAEQFGAGLVKTTLVGALTLIPLVVAGTMITKTMASAPGKFAGIFLVIAAIFIALAGAAGLALRIGQGLRSAGDEQAPWRKVFRGGVVLALTLGTLVLLPVVLCAGFGAFVLTRTGSRAAAVSLAAHE